MRSAEAMSDTPPDLQVIYDGQVMPRGNTLFSLGARWPIELIFCVCVFLAYVFTAMLPKNLRETT